MIENFTRGDTIPLYLTIKSDDVPMDLTGSTVTYTMKTDLDQEDIDAAIQIKQSTHTEPLDGKTEIIITAAMTSVLAPGTYYYDLQLVDSGAQVTTLLSSTLKVFPDVTRDIV